MFIDKKCVHRFSNFFNHLQKNMLLTFYESFKDLNCKSKALWNNNCNNQQIKKFQISLNCSRIVEFGFDFVSVLVLLF